MIFERPLRLLLGPQMGKKNLARLLRRLGQSARAGVAVLESWKTEIRSTASPRERHYLTQIHQDISNGDLVHEAMARCDGLFPPLTVQMVEIGETVGRLDEVYIDLADYYDRLVALRRTFLLGIMWPCIQLVIAIFVVALLIFIVGLLPVEIDILGFGLVGSRGLVKYFTGIFFIGTLLTLGVVGLLRGWYGTAPMLLAMRLPAVGPYLRDSSLARMSWTLAMALEAGVDAIRSMQMALDSTQNVVFQGAAPDAVRSIRNGQEFHESLRVTGVFPTDFVNSLEAAELAGSESTSLLHLSEQYDQRAKSASQVITVVSSFLIWGAIALLIIALIVRLASFYLGTIYDALEMQI